MGSKQKTLIIASWLISLVILLCWSTSQSMVVFWATTRHPKIAKSTMHSEEADWIEYKRSEQKFFQSYGLYLPLEDIMFIAQLPSGGTRYADALRRTCSGVIAGSGIAIWLPLKIKLPLVGERVFEWCWKPPMHRQK